jgi:hypothetical protein
MERTRRLLRHPHTEPYILFDGNPLPLAKRSTKQERKRRVPSLLRIQPHQNSQIHALRLSAPPSALKSCHTAASNSSPTENPILLPHQNQTFSFGGALYGRYRVSAGINTLLLWSPSYNRLLRPRVHHTLTFSIRSLQGVFPTGGQVTDHPSLLEVLPRYSMLL